MVVLEESLCVFSSVDMVNYHMIKKKKKRNENTLIYYGNGKCRMVWFYFGLSSKCIIKEKNNLGIKPNHKWFGSF